MTTINHTPHDRRMTWAVVGLNCLDAGHIDWAVDAFGFAREDTPPRTWPDRHPAKMPNLAPRPGWGMKLLGRGLIRVIKIRAWLRGVR